MQLERTEHSTDARATTARQKLLIVDDDADFCTLLQEDLDAYQDFECHVVGTGRACIATCVEGSTYDLVILDVGLPDMDGREACKIIRRNGFQAPVILLTAETSHADEILGLDAGANDYVTKPFRFPVLLARVRSQLRQSAHSAEAVISLGPYRFKPAEKLLVQRNGTRIKLTTKETLILKFLHRSASNLASRDMLLREVWGYSPEASTHTVETHIYRLRQKIEPDPAKAAFLQTVSGGYRLAV
ncbi:MAG: response regulator transcription factor [Hyphomicrobiaceae bacterium]